MGSMPSPAARAPLSNEMHVQITMQKPVQMRMHRNAQRIVQDFLHLHVTYAKLRR